MMINAWKTRAMRAGGHRWSRRSHCISVRRLERHTGDRIRGRSGHGRHGRRVHAQAYRRAIEASLRDTKEAGWIR